MEIVKADGTPINGLGNALSEIGKRQAEAHQKLELFAKNFEEMTGYKPHQQINALDVVKIAFAIYGEPK
jgi:hypothetical protein